MTIPITPENTATQIANLRMVAEDCRKIGGTASVIVLTMAAKYFQKVTADEARRMLRNA